MEIFTVLVSIVLLIVFFVMALNISSIKRKLINIEYQIEKNETKVLTLAHKEEFKGNNKEAINYYLEFLYDVIYNKNFLKDMDKKESIQWLKNKIDTLGGKLPKSVENVIKK